MTRLIFLITAGIIAYKIYGGFTDASDPGQPEKITPVQNVAAAERSNVLLFTGTAWCPACKTLEKQIVGTSQWRQFVRNEVNFTVYDIARDPRHVGPREVAAMQRYKVNAFPTMMVVDSQGRVLSQRVGVAGDLEAYKRWIRGS